MLYDRYAGVLEDGAHPQRGGSVRHRPGNSILLLVRLSPRDARRRHRRATRHAAPHGGGGRVAHGTRCRFPGGERRSVDDPPRLAFAESLVHSGMVAVRFHWRLLAASRVDPDSANARSGGRGLYRCAERAVPRSLPCLDCARRRGLCRSDRHLFPDGCEAAPGERRVKYSHGMLEVVLPAPTTRAFDAFFNHAVRLRWDTLL